VLSTAAPIFAAATTYTYIGPNGGDWATSSYWSPAGPPSTGAVAFFAPLGSGSYTYDYSLSGLGTIIFGNSSPASFSAPTLTQSGSTQIGAGVEIFDQGTYAQNGGTNVVSKTGTMAVGDGTLDSANYLLSGGTLSAGDFFVGAGTSSAGTVSVTGGTFNSSEMLIGFNQGAGNFFQSGSTSLVSSTGSLLVGFYNGGTGTVNLSAGTFSAPSAQIGDQGSGTLIQTGSSVLSLGTLGLTVGNGSNSTGLAALSGGTLNLSGILNVGASGAAGTLSQSGTSNINLTAGMFVGNGLLATGTANFSGGTLTATSQVIDVGFAGGAGTFIQSGTSDINLGLGQIYFGLDGTGVASLSGGTLNVAGGQIGVGFGGGTGSLFQSGTSSINLGNGSLLIGTGGAGTDTFTGGFLSAVNGSIFVGANGGAGTFLQSGTADLISSSGTLQVGSGTGSSGTVSVSGGTFGISLAGAVNDIGNLGGAGTFQINGGMAFLSGQSNVGASPASAGTIILSSGSLDAPDINIGFNGGAGTFLQTGTQSSCLLGINTFSVGNGTGSTGTVILSAGTMISGFSTNIGSLGGSGTFIQNGSLSVSQFNFSLNVGAGTGSSGTVLLSGGSLTGGVYVGVAGGTGAFIQSGGSSNIGGLFVGNSGTGTFSLIAGSMTTIATSLVGGNNGSDANPPGGGTFMQSGGISNFNGGLSVGDGTGTSGTFILTGGSATIGDDMGIFGGTFLQSGGSSSLGDNIDVGGGAPGYLSLTGGTLVTGGVFMGDGLAGNGTLQQSGSQTFSRLGSIYMLSNATLLLSGGTMNISTITSQGTIQVSGGTMSVQSNLYSNDSLAISGGTIALTGAGSLGSGSINAAGFTISGPGVLDVGSSGLVIEYGNGPSPVGDLSFAHTARNYPAGSIQRYAQTAIDNLNWDGPGISSSYAQNDPNGLTAVGIVDENDLGIYPNDYTVAGGGTGTWMGQSINDPNNVLVRMTYYGDGNLDGVVNRFDVTALSQGYSGLAGYVGWSDGDYNYDGQINKNDVSLLAASYVFQGAPLGDAITPGQAQYMLALDPDMPANVQAEFDAIADGQTPEPASFAVLCVAGVGLLGRRRRTYLALVRARHDQE
jgi:hypothetical protein